MVGWLEVRHGAAYQLLSLGSRSYPVSRVLSGPRPGGRWVSTVESAAAASASAKSSAALSAR